MSLIEEISGYLQKGRAKNVKALVQQALDENMDPKEIFSQQIGADYYTADAASCAEVAKKAVIEKKQG